MEVEASSPYGTGTDRMPSSDARPPWPGQPTAVLCGFCYPTTPIELSGQMQGGDLSATTGLVPADTTDEGSTSLPLADTGAIK